MGSVLGNQRKGFPDNVSAMPAHTTARSYAIALAYLFGFTELHLLGNVGRGAVARKVFGQAAVDQAVEQVTSVLHGWGQRSPQVTVRTASLVCHALLLNRSPLLADLSEDTLQALRANMSVQYSLRQNVHSLHRALAALGYVGPPRPPRRLALAPAEGVDPVRPKWACKTKEHVHMLFSCAPSPVAKRSDINHTTILRAARQGGRATADVRGNITSHRARSTIASQLYNAKEPMTLFELQAWLGHRSPSATQHYAKIAPKTLAKAYSDAGYFARNVRTIEVLVDRDAVTSGAAAPASPGSTTTSATATAPTVSSNNAHTEWPVPVVISTLRRTPPRRNYWRPRTTSSACSPASRSPTTNARRRRRTAPPSPHVPRRLADAPPCTVSRHARDHYHAAHRADPNREILILWNQNCQVHEEFPVRICTIGSMVTVAGVPSSRGVGPAGVGTSASRSSSAVTAVCPSSTAARSSSVSGMLASMRCRLSLASSSWALVESFGV